jgi:hypothetical protein
VPVRFAVGVHAIVHQVSITLKIHTVPVIFAVGVHAIVHQVSNTLKIHTVGMTTVFPSKWKRPRLLKGRDIVQSLCLY